MESKQLTFSTLLEEFKHLLGVSDWTPPKNYEDAFNEILTYVTPSVSSREGLIELLEDACADKLNIYYSTVHNIIDECAKNKIYFNYNQKLYLFENIKNREVIRSFLISNGVDCEYAKSLIRYSTEDINEFRNRIDRLKTEDNKWKDVLDSIFARFLYSVFEKEEIEKYNSKVKQYDADYFKFLRLAYPEKYARNNALSVLHITLDLYKKYKTYNDFIGFIFAFIRHEYKYLNNHSYLSIYIDDLGQKENESIQWRLYSDIVLFSEKHNNEKLKIGYFHPAKIKEITVSYIPELDDNVDFETAFGGFTYKDCYIITQDAFDKLENDTPYSLLLLLQKNHRDEELIPCPSCRSINVRGNSYPIIGVKSWECKNPLCPDKSKYNRGKRYSFASILKQESISSEENEIEKGLINDWRLDVISQKSLVDILTMLIKEYSFVGDVINLYNLNGINIEDYKRTIKEENIPDLYENPYEFWECDYFKRFLIPSKKVSDFQQIPFKDNISIFQGNCSDVLNSLEEDSICGAVTSPPYYNAKEYSNWDNIYCYLYDMYNHARAIYRVLKPGSYFLYNIFDYFDNEKNLVFSDMGKKRMILGAYIIYMFRRVGFKMVDNIIWYKGHVQGNRSNNQGNNSPYYQSPLNCYEHIFIFRKPGPILENDNFPKLLNASPVIKMVKGRNILGHTAPFPSAIPNIMLNRIKHGPILDPYAGSFTTSRTALHLGVSSIGIELSPKYCELGMRLIEQDINRDKEQLDLFD